MPFISHIAIRLFFYYLFFQNFRRDLMILLLMMMKVIKQTLYAANEIHYSEGNNFPMARNELSWPIIKRGDIFQQRPLDGIWRAGVMPLWPCTECPGGDRSRQVVGSRSFMKSFWQQVLVPQHHLALCPHPHPLAPHLAL